MENKTVSSESAFDSLMEAFDEYAKHRRDKGTAIAKLNAWNHLVFRMTDIKNRASQQCAELQKRIELLERDLIQETGKCMKYQHEIATSPLQSENESLKKRVDRYESVLNGIIQLKPLIEYAEADIQHENEAIAISEMFKSIEKALNPLS